MPSVHGKVYDARSRRSISGTSESRAPRNVSSGIATASCRGTAMAISISSRPRQLRARELQVYPGFALFAWTAQQIGRVIGHDQRRRALAEPMHLSTQAPYRDIGRQQVLRGDSTHGEY